MLHHAAYGTRMTPTDGIASLSAPERLGVKTGRGFYDHPPAKGRKRPEATPASDLARFQSGGFARDLPAETLVDRCVLAMLNEAARCLEEGVVADAAALDLGTVFGMGFPPFHGGLMRWADSVGTAEITARLERIASAPDIAAREGGVAKFTPAAMLSELGRGGERFRVPRLLVAS